MYFISVYVKADPPSQETGCSINVYTWVADTQGSTSDFDELFCFSCGGFFCTAVRYVCLYPSVSLENTDYVLLVIFQVNMQSTDISRHLFEVTLPQPHTTQ